jgi:Uma2 family endonuclease
MPVASTIKMRADQFLQLGEDPPGVRLELVNGEIVVSPSPIPDHSTVIFALGRLLGNHNEEHQLGELFGDVDTILDQYNVRRPDILFFFNDRLDLVGEKAMEGPPDLAIEVISPSSVEVDRRQKFNEYRKAGVKYYYWIVDPAKRSFEGYVLKSRRYILAGKATGEQSISLPPFDDLQIPLGKLWRRKRR